MDAWVERELAAAEFPDERLKARLGHLLGDLGERIGGTLPMACKDWAATKAAYRFFDNPRVDDPTILAGHFAATADRCSTTTGIVSVLHDTTAFRFTRNTPDGVGYLSYVKGRHGIREAMLPADCIRMVDATASVADALTAAHLDMHTRFPVTERPGDPQGIIGYVNFKDLVAILRLSPSEPSVRGIVRAIPGLPVNGSVAASLDRLIREQTHIALVRDAAGAVVGMVTLEDIMEELVGDIQDEFDSLYQGRGMRGT